MAGLVHGPNKMSSARLRMVEFTDEQLLLLRRMAHYIWWETAETAVAWPERLIAQVMDRGDWDDLLDLENAFADELLAAVLQNAQAGWFSPQSWAFWHYRLGLTPFDASAPPLPRRQIHA